MRATKVEVLRESVSKIVPILSGRGIDVSQMGMHAFVQYDPRTKKPIRVNIPYIPDEASDDLMIAIQGFIDHEVAHVLYSDAKYVEFAQKAKVEGLYGIIEDTFIERKMKAAYRGSKHNLIQTWQFVQDKLVAPAVRKSIETGNPETIFGALLVPLMRLHSGQKECEPFVNEHVHHIQKFVDIIGADLFEKLPKINSSEEGYKLAVAMHNRVEELRRRTEEEKKERERKAAEKSKKDSKPKSLDDVKDEDITGPSDSDGPSSDFPGGGESEVEEEIENDAATSPSDSDEEAEDEADDSDEAGTSKSEDEDSEEDESASDEEAEDGDDEYEDGEGEEEDKGSRDEESLSRSLESVFETSKDLDKMMDSMISAEVGKALGATSYFPFTKDFDRIEEFKPTASATNQGEWLERLDKAVSDHVAPLQRHLERCVAAKSHSRMIPGHRSGRINPTALHRIVTGDERLFRRKHISKTKDAAISLVVDLSGSMSGSKVRLAMETAYAMSVSLDRLNITHEVIGFTTTNLPHTGAEGRRVREVLEEISSIRLPSRIEPVYMPVFKPFNSKLTIERKRAMACYHEISLRNNTDGEAIEYAARRLAGRRESRKIMIVLSDGSPCAGAGSYAEQAWHLKSTVMRLEASGIETFGIGIEDASVRSFYPKYAILNDLADLPKTVMGQLEKMLLDQQHAA